MNLDRMRVQFTYSQEDVVDAAMRFSARSKSLRALRHKRTAWAALLSWLLVFAIFRFSIKAAIAGLVAALLVVIIDPFTYNYQHRKSLRKLLKERYDQEDNFVCEVELLSEGLKTSGKNSQCRTEWERLRRLKIPLTSLDVRAVASAFATGRSAQPKSGSVLSNWRESI